MYSGGGSAQQSGGYHASSNPSPHPPPAPPGFTVQPSYCSQVPMTAHPQSSPGLVVVDMSPTQPLSQIQGWPQPIPSMLQQSISQGLQQGVQQQVSLYIQGAQAAKVATLERRIHKLEQEVKRLCEELDEARNS